VNLCLLVFCMSISGGPVESDRWFAEDKYKHFFTSFAATTIAAAGARTLGMDADRSLAAGVGFGAGVGVWKEIRDARRPGGHFSVRDLVWDFAGVGAGAAVVGQAR
jgi:uncharacterized protein YfiM (DUF2279 family)